MCFGGSAPEIDDTPILMQQDAAAEARAEEEARQAQIEKGRTMLDALFDGGEFTEPGQWHEATNTGGDAPGEAQWGVSFQPGTETQSFEGYQPYLDDRRNTLMDFYTPQFDDRFQSAQDDLTFSHARAGTLQSSMAADNVGELANRADQERTSLLGDIDGDINQTRNRFEDTRMNLENLLATSGDAARTMNVGMSQLNNLYSQQPQTSRLGDIFANAFGAIGQYGQGYQQGRVGGIYAQPNITSMAGGGGGSSQIIR